MEEGKTIISQLYKRLDGKVIIAADLNDNDIEGADIDDLAVKIISFFEGCDGLKILDRNILEQIKKQTKTKEPLQVVVEQQPSFRPVSKEFEPQFRIKNIDVEKTGATVSDFAAYFRDRYRKLREILGSSQNVGMVVSTDKLAQYANGREVGIVGMVYDKIITKKGNLMITIEDEYGSAKIIFVRPESGARKEQTALFESAMHLVNDEVVALKGKLGSPPFIIAKQIIWPDVPVHSRKQSSEDLAIALTSDVHVGSKLFMEKNFVRFVEWLNGNVDTDRELAGKVKYVVFGGDLVDGIGVYPGQDRELTIQDIYKQYSVFFDYVDNIPDYIQVFVIPGNHDAVQLADPQPMLTKELIGEFKKDNVHFLSSPSHIEIEGLRVLAYHGTSLDSVIHNIAGCSYFKPEGAMVELLKRRHISPIYGDNPIVPSRNDSLVISDPPDILHMGHVHKNGTAEYHGTQIVNSGTWQARTEYQIKLGHMPTPCMLPVYRTKKATIENVDFSGL